MKLINVRKIDNNGNDTNHPFLNLQCINIGLSFEKPYLVSNGAHRVNNVHYGLALIDTGADFILFNRRLLTPNAVCVEQVYSSGINGVSLENNYEIALVIPEADAMLNVGGIPWDRPQNAPYDFILGRKFLQMCEFTYCRHIGITELKYFANTDNAI